MRLRASIWFILIGAIGAFAISVLLFHKSDEPKLKVDLVGFTNQFRGEGREALLVLSNRSDATVILTILPERKHPEWPAHNRITWNPLLTLPGHSVTNLRVRLLPNEGTWRVRFPYRSPLTQWEGMRNRWSIKLRALKWHRLSKWVEADVADVVFSPEVKL